MASAPWFDERRRSWVMKYRPDPTGKWVRVTLAKHQGGAVPKKPPQLVVDRAREFAEIEYRAKHGISGGPVRPNSLAAYLERYVSTYHVGRSPKSVLILEHRVREFLEFVSARGITTLQGVDRATCRDFLVHLAGRLEPSTIKTARSYLSAIWSQAEGDGTIPFNPWRSAKLPAKVVPPKPTFWTPEEVAKIADHAAPWAKDLILVLANTGIRISATLAMRWAWVDWKANTITVPKEYSKGGKPYAIAMSQGARDVLQRRYVEHKRSELVFPSERPTAKGASFSLSGAGKAFTTAVRRSKVRPGTLHDLRHTYARALMARGVPANVVQAQLGHSSLMMTQRYTTADEKDAQRFVEGFEFGVRRAETSDDPDPRQS